MKDLNCPNDILQLVSKNEGLFSKNHVAETSITRKTSHSYTTICVQVTHETCIFNYKLKTEQWKTKKDKTACQNSLIELEMQYQQKEMLHAFWLYSLDKTKVSTNVFLSPPTTTSISFVVPTAGNCTLIDIRENCTKNLLLMNKQHSYSLHFLNNFTCEGWSPFYLLSFPAIFF